VFGLATRGRQASAQAINAQAAAPRRSTGTLRSAGAPGQDQGGARPHGDRSAGDDHAGQQPDHDPHPARSRPARQRRRFPGLCVWLTALMTGSGPPQRAGRARLPSGANPIGARASCRPPPRRASPSRRRAGARRVPAGFGERSPAGSSKASLTRHGRMSQAGAPGRP
jgi:hypothetical protein